MSESEWMCVVCGSIKEERVGTEYIRKEFKGVTGMGAIEVGFKYNDNGRDGVGLCDKGAEGLEAESSIVSTLPNPSLYIRFS